MIEIGCQTYSLRRYGLEEMLGSVRKAGFRAVELWAGHASYTEQPSSAARIRRAADEVGIAIQAYSVGGFVRAAVATVEVRLMAAFAYADALGVELVTGVIDRRAVPVVDVLCRRTGIRFAIENHWYADLARAEDYLDALRATCPEVGVALDTGHLAVAGGTPLAAVDLLGDRVFDIHLKDVTVPGRLARWLGRRPRMECRPLGTGEAPVQELLAALARRQHRICIALEDERKDVPLSELQASLRACQSLLRTDPRLRLASA